MGRDDIKDMHQHDYRLSPQKHSGTDLAQI